MNVKKYLIYGTLAVWTLWCIVGISKNYQKYNLLSWIIVLTVFGLPYLIIPLLPLTEKIRGTSNNQKNEANSTTPEAATQYLEIENQIIRTDGNRITDEEIPYLVQLGAENALRLEEEHKHGTHNIFNDHTFSSDEELFFAALLVVLKDNKLKPHLLKLQRLSDKTFNVDYAGLCYIGKIKLNGRKTYMQYSRGMTTVKHLENPTLQECIDTIPYWIRYIKYCKRN